MKAYHRKMTVKNDCAMESTLNIISGKWKLAILATLFKEGIIRPSQMLRESPDVSRKVLLQQLQELEMAGIVKKNIYAEVPPRVEYSLTRVGESLQPVLQALHQWGMLYNKGIG